MGKPLIIVESPAKARSMSKYLDGDFTALASYGHVRDLLPKDGAVLPDQGFAMRYEVIERNKKHVDAIARAMHKADALYLATDPDREGEAISWHLHEVLKAQNAIGNKPVYRVEFHEITASAIRAAVDNPRELSSSLIDAQQARRALDYLVGFNLSPLLWKKVRYGLSAGRVQSPALRLICEREAEIEQFVPREYWTVEASLRVEGGAFTARLTHFEDHKLEQFSITDGARARHIEAALTEAASGTLTVSRVDAKQRKRHPAPPFTTSTLQQEASRKLGFNARRTMRTAQQLYEGIDVEDGATGLITYMRTDSVALATEAVGEIRKVIAERYGADSVADHIRVFKNKTKNAQEAHEAVRPTLAARTPLEIKRHLSEDQFRLYDLIWKRTVACQMMHATIDTVAVDLTAGDAGTFRANGSTISVPGFMAVYTEGRDDKKSDADQDVILPAMAQGETIIVNTITPHQHFTEPPPRYNEATLVKTLEAYGIGRPSTYAAIISTLQHREYVTMEKRCFEPTDIGTIVNRFLSEHFSRYIDYEFTARMEDTLDAISRGEKQWVLVMQDFWKPFAAQVEEKEASISRDDVTRQRVLGTDPKSGKPVSSRMGRYGPYVQVGEREDQEKPTFASLRPGQKLDTITLEQALDLLKLPRILGETPQGETVTVAIGRFGPYVKYGDKFVSLGKDNDPYTVDLHTALTLVEQKKVFDANRVILDFADAGLRVLNGRYGPYVTDGTKNARILKDCEDPKTLTLEDCKRLMEHAKPVRGRGKAGRHTGARKATKGGAGKTAKGGAGKTAKGGAGKTTKGGARKTAKGGVKKTAKVNTSKKNVTRKTNNR